MDKSSANVGRVCTPAFSMGVSELPVLLHIRLQLTIKTEEINTRAKNNAIFFIFPPILPLKGIIRVHFNKERVTKVLQREKAAKNFLPPYRYFLNCNIAHVSSAQLY